MGLWCKAGLTAAIFCALQVPAQSADLINVFEEAISSDPTLLAARADLRSRSELRRQARSNLLPQITGDASLGDGSTDVAIGGVEIEGITDTDTEGYGVTLRQSIYDHRNYRRLDAAGYQVTAAEYRYEDEVQSFLLRVADRYFAVLTAVDAVRFAEAEARAVGRQLEQAEQRYEVGLTAITDVHESKARADNARARVIVAENTLDDAREALRELTGQYMGELEALVQELPLEIPEPRDVDEWVAVALAENPALEAAELDAQVAEENIGIERGGHFPTLDLVASYNNSVDNALAQRDDFGRVVSTTTQEVDATRLTLQLSVPIFSGFNTSSRVRQAAADHEAAMQRLEQTRRATVRETRNAFRGTEASILEVQAREQAVISAQSALEATEAGFEVGTRTIVDVLISQQQLFQAQRDYSQTRHQYVLNRLRLKDAAGTLSREDLAEINLLLAPRPIGGTDPTPSDGENDGRG